MVAFSAERQGFCESEWNGKHEYLNSFSSLLMSVIAIIGAKYNFYNNDVKMLFISLFVNGFASFALHWTNQYGWGLYDESTMILICVFGVTGMLKEIQYIYGRYQTFAISIIPIIYLASIIMSLGLNDAFVFRMLFGVFLGAICITLVVIKSRLNELPGFNIKILQDAIAGFLLIAIAGFSWIMTEIYCNKYKGMKYVPGHVVWHICVAYGGYFVIQLITALSLYRKKYKYDYKSYALTEQPYRWFFPRLENIEATGNIATSPTHNDNQMNQDIEANTYVSPLHPVPETDRRRFTSAESL